MDLMALDSNAMCSADGCPLRHFTVGPSPHSAGINIFSARALLVKGTHTLPPTTNWSPYIFHISSKSKNRS